MTIWSFPPNWRQPVTVSYEFKTDLFTSRSGKEQRRATRTTPRRVIKFTISRAADDFRRFNALMKSQGSAITMADLGRFARVTLDPASAATTLQVDTVPAWLSAGATLLLGDRQGYSSVAVGSVTGSVVTLAAPLGRAWIGAKLHPSLSGWLNDSIDAQGFGDRTVEASIVFAQDPGSGPVLDVGYPDDIFNRREVLVYYPNFKGGISGSFAHPRDTVDMGRGLTATFVPITFGTRTRQYHLVAPSSAERDRLLNTFLRMKGQRGEFYLPTWEDDFVIVSSTSTTLTIAGTMVDTMYHADDVNRALMIERAGVRYYRRVTSCSNDGTNSTLTTDFAWPCTMDAAATVTWLVVNRFATDQLDVEMVTDEVANVQVSVRSLEDLAVSDADNVYPFGDTAEWTIDYFGYAGFITIADGLDRVVTLYVEATA